MARRGDGAHQRERALVARETARLLAEGSETDPARARRKVAARLGVHDDAALPGGDEIRAALAAHRELFARNDDTVPLRAQREAALAAMDYFAAFQPRLVGPVLDGSAGPRTPVTLHLHADDPDAVARTLLERGIPARQRGATLRLDRHQHVEVPAWTFVADGLPFEVLQLPLTALRQPPRETLEDRAQERAGIAALRRLLEADADD
jgi:hypothetical protein